MAENCFINSRQAAKIIGAGYQAVDKWISAGVLPIGNPAPGTGSRRVFQFADLVQARAIVQMRTQGLPLETIKKAVAMIGEHYSDPMPEAARILVVGGDRLYWTVGDSEMLAVLVEQTEWPVMVVPVGQIAASIRAKFEAVCS